MPIACHSNARLSASLIDALMNHGDVPGAQSIFDRLQHPTITAYGAMMKGIRVGLISIDEFVLSS